MFINLKMFCNYGAENIVNSLQENDEPSKFSKVLILTKQEEGAEIIIS